MPDDDNLVPQGGSEPPVSTTEEVLRLLREQSASSNGDDTLDNPELEQLFGSLSQGLEEDLPDSGPLTLEDLALGVPAVQPVCEGIVCAGCGSRSPAGTRFCGMCGHEFDKSSTSGEVSGNGSERAVAIEAVPQAAAAQPEAIAPTSASQSWKMAFLALLCLMLGLAVYQQPSWPLPGLRSLFSRAPSPAPPMPKTLPVTASHVAEPAPAASEPSSPTVRPPSPMARPSKPTSPLPASPASEPRSKAAATVGVPAAPSPSAAKPEAPEHAPASATPPAPIELPTIINLPHSSPVLEGARPVVPGESLVPKISEGAVPGALIFRVNPQYPAGARSSRVQGSVVMHAVVGTDGTVQQLRVISGNPLLVSAAMEAVKKWRYRPFLLGGKPVEGETTITVNFKGE